MGMKMQEIEDYRGVLEVKGSGLRIGGSKDVVGIGETDNPIIRHPITHRPYVPGSSVKGKIRCLLEQKYSERAQTTGKPCDCGTCFICLLFGCGDSKSIQSPTRLVFRDCQPTAETVQIWDEAGVDSEIKTEVLIDRNKGNAFGRIGPRTMERIPAGAKFDFGITVRFFEGDDRRDLYSRLGEGFSLLEKHYLGGSGSRGYGEVEIKTVDGENFANYLTKKARSDEK
ncbi:MAG: type III-A CRISPR-associated RAMP protein Csm3 [Deltaproteobacteria bacterium]